MVLRLVPGPWAEASAWISSFDEDAAGASVEAVRAVGRLVDLVPHLGDPIYVYSVVGAAAGGPAERRGQPGREPALAPAREQALAAAEVA